MNNGWIKLHRKLNDNKLIKDTNALQIFIWVLLNVDKNTGTIKIGRKWLSGLLGLNPNTFYGCLTRLSQTYRILETTTIDNNQATQIRVLNWAKYQSTNEETTTTKNKTSIVSQLSRNTLQEERIENKNINNNDKNSDEFSDLKKMIGIPETPLKGISYEFQSEALRIIEALGIPASRKSAYFKAVKEEPQRLILQAYSFAEDHPTPAARDKMFFWKLNELKGGLSAKSIESN